MKQFVRALCVASVVVVTACESESDPSGPNPNNELPELNEIVTSAPLNATASDTLVYFSFASNALVARTADWDIALRRYEIRLNGGISGTKGVLGFSLENNKTATDAQVLGMTVANTLAAFDAVRDGQIPADNAFVSDRLEENDIAYANFSGAPSANSSAYWKVRTATGGYALMHVTAFTYSQMGALTSFTVESRLQTGSTLGAPQQVTMPVAAAPLAFSLSANGAVTPSGCNWDFQVHPNTFGMTANTACNAGTFPGAASPSFASATSASDAPEYGAYLSTLASPIPNSVTDDGAPFRYNLQADNRLYPAFNTYLVKVGANVYKLQAINYYDAAGASAHPTLRFARIR